MQIDSVDFEEITIPMPTDWVMRLVIRGTGLEPRAMRLVAEVGPQAVQGLMPDVEQGVVLGFLTAVPTPGDELRIGYADEPLTSTGLTFTAPTPPVS